MNGLVVVAPACVAGIMLLQRQGELPPAGLAGACVLLACAVAVAWTFMPARDGAFKASAARRVAVALLVFVIAFAAGFGWAAWRAQQALSDALDPRWEGRDVTVTGVVASLPQPFERGARFEFDIESASAREGIAPSQIPSHVSLAWYNGLSPEEFQEIQPVRAGERWRFTVRLRRPHGSVNEHGFDFEAWMLERGIRATGYVRPGGSERIDAMVWRPGYMVERARESLRERFWDALPDARYAGILVALAIGDQRAIEPDEWQAFARTGVSHLMSISGLHVTMISGLFGWLVLFVWRRVPALALRLPAQKAGAAAAAAGALAYCLVSGFAVPAQRTLYMVSVVALALILDRTSAAMRVLALALLVVVLLDPWAVLSPGFWLSFGAVAVIFYVSGRGTEEEVPEATDGEAEHGWLRRSLGNWAKVQWAVTVGLVPLLLVLFGQVSIVSPLANAVAIPVVSFVITPLALAGALLPFDALLQLAEWVTGLLVPWLQWLSKMDGAVWQQHAPAWWTVPPALLGTACLLAPKEWSVWGIQARGWTLQAVGAVLMVPMFVVAPRGPGPGQLWLTVFDVGQGLSVLARTEHHALLYDAGPMWSPQADSGSRVLLPYLRGEGIASLDALVLSHDDNDHVGGAASILAGLSVARMLTSMALSELPGALRTSAVPYRLPCRAGDAWEWDGVRFEWLHPGTTELDDAWGAPNDRSCVLRVATRHGAALIAGDIERAAEGALLARGANLAADALIVPHHGSGTSSTPAFIGAVSPRTAIFSVGYRNRFGHPRADVWARYAGTERIRTDEAGAVSLRFADGGMAVERARVANRRYWHGR